MKKSLAITVATFATAAVLLSGCRSEPVEVETSTSPETTSEVTPDPTPEETTTFSTMVGGLKVTGDKTIADEWTEVSEGQYQFEDNVFAQIVAQDTPVAGVVKTDDDIEDFFKGLAAGFVNNSEFPEVKSESEVKRDASNNPYVVVELGEEGLPTYYLIAKLIDTKTIVTILSPLDETVTIDQKWVTAFSTLA